MLKPFASTEDRLERQEFIRLLRETPPDVIARMGEAATIEAFQRVARTVPFYAAMLRELDVDPSTVTDIASFVACAPLLDKHNTFGRHPISQLCTGGDLDGVRSVLTSSGMSGVFSFGVNTIQNLARSAKSIDAGLQYLFNVDEISTLLINCLPMGVKVHTRATVLAETSVREDMVFAVIKKFASEFEQILIVGEGSFIKKIIEDGRDEHRIDWPRLNVHLITGEEGIAENYRSYVGALLGVDVDSPDSRIIGSSMGVAELDLNIFHETRDTIRVRRLAHGNPSVRKALFGTANAFCPMLFVYYPHRCFVEEISVPGGGSELVVSMLSEEMKIPLLRYRSGDFGRVLRYEDLVRDLGGMDHPMEPDLHVPWVAVEGRGHALATDGGPILPEAVKESLYRDAAVAEAITGNFRLSPEGKHGKLEIQLRTGRNEPVSAVDSVLEALAIYASVQPAVEFQAFTDFRYNTGVDYERKFSYLG